MVKQKIGRKYAVRYPWDDWFRRPAFTLVRGRDFWCLLHGMVGMVRNVARVKGLRVSVRVVAADRIKVEVLDDKELGDGLLDETDLSYVRR